MPNLNDMPMLASKKKGCLPFLPGLEEDRPIFMAPSNRSAVCVPLKRTRLPSAEQDPQIGEPVPLKSHHLSDLDVVSTPPVSLASIISPFRRKPDLPPPLPDLSELQTKNDFSRPFLQRKDQTKASSRVYRPTLLPRAEVCRSKKRKGEANRALLVETCSLIAADENSLTDINDKVAECQIDLPSMIPDGVTLEQRCRSLKPRKT